MCFYKQALRDAQYSSSVYLKHCQYQTCSFLPFLAHPTRLSYTLRRLGCCGVSPEAVLKERCPIFPPIPGLSPSRWQRCSSDAAGRGVPERERPDWSRAKEEDMKTNAKRLLARFASRSIQKRAAF